MSACMGTFKHVQTSFAHVVGCHVGGIQHPSRLIFCMNLGGGKSSAHFFTFTYLHDHLVLHEYFECGCDHRSLKPKSLLSIKPRFKRRL
jgi:hypothetical protein